MRLAGHEDGINPFPQSRMRPARAQLKLQGRYMTAMRQLTPLQKARVKVVIGEWWFEAALIGRLRRG